MQVQPELLAYADVAEVTVAIPVMVLSLVYHNVAQLVEGAFCST